MPKVSVKVTKKLNHIVEFDVSDEELSNMKRHCSGYAADLASKHINKDNFKNYEFETWQHEEDFFTVVEQ